MATSKGSARASKERARRPTTRRTTMRSFEDLVPYDELPGELVNAGQTCEHGASDVCGAPADISIWKDFGFYRHRWTETMTLCADHFNSNELPSYGRALPLTERARAFLDEKARTERPLGTGGTE